MTDLVTWLRAALDEDERGALAPAERNWRPNGANSCEVYAHDFETGASRTIARCKNGHDDDFANALHIARHDPARILAEVAAKRAVMDAAFEYEAKIDGEWGDCHEPDAIAAGLCPETFVDNIPLLRALALPYADRPGYREEWKP